MKKIVSIFSFLFFLIFSNSLLAEVDIELLKQKYPKCENENYRHECFDEFKMDLVDTKYIGYFRNNHLWNGQYFEKDILIIEFVNGEQITKAFCKEEEDGWVVCPPGNRSKPLDGGYYDEKGNRNGKFVIEYIGNEKFVGNYKNNKRFGKGIYLYESGSKYDGEWQDDRKHGQGTYTYANGDIYVGEYKDDVRNGQGNFTYSNGDKYVGEFKFGNFHGQGTYTFVDGSKDVGEWENDKLNGYAIQYNADGTIRREGIFKDDEFLYAETREKKEPSKLDKYKSTCEELGFTPGTEKFGDCVMKLMDKD